MNGWMFVREMPDMYVNMYGEWLIGTEKIKLRGPVGCSDFFSSKVFPPKELCHNDESSVSLALTKTVATNSICKINQIYKNTYK